MTGNHVVQSLMRAVDILECVGRSEDGATLQELSKELGLKPPTVHNLARTLTLRHLLEKVQGPTRYRLGGAVRDLARIQTGSRLLLKAPELMRGIHKQFPDAAVVLAQSFSGDVYRVMRLSPERPGVIERPRGESMQPYTTASATLFQAYWSGEERSAYRRRHPFPEYGAGTWASEEDYDALVTETRKQGYATLRFRRSGYFSVSAPVFSPGHELLGAFGASLGLKPGETEKGRRMVSLVVKSAQRLSESVAEEPD